MDHPIEHDAMEIDRPADQFVPCKSMIKSPGHTCFDLQLQHPNLRCRPCGHFHCRSAEAVRRHLGRRQWKVSDDIGFPRMVLTEFNSVARSPTAPGLATLHPTYSFSQRPCVPTPGNPSLPENIDTPPPPLPASTAIYSVTARHITPTTGECMSTLGKVKVLTYIIADVPRTFSLSQRCLPIRTQSPDPTPTTGTPVPMSMGITAVPNSECPIPDRLMY
jgi:hypothetical protein